MKSQQNKPEKKAYRYFFIFFLTGIFIIMLIFQFASFMLQGEQPIAKRPKIQKVRGSINDRNGNLLAVQTKVYNLGADKRLVNDVQTCAEVLSSIIEIPADDILKKFDTASSDYFYLKKKLTETEKAYVAQAIKEHGLKGLQLEEIINRTYPESTLASTVIGFVGDEGYGLEGMEYSAQNILSPPETTEGYNGKGYNIFLTLDSTVQYLMQQKAERIMDEWQAESVMFLAVEAKTGEILGYVNMPSTDLSKFSQSTPEQLMDRPANYIYEPGSVFKIFSLASLLEVGAITPNTVYNCDGKYEFKNASPITCLKPHGTVTPKSVIEHSCNVGIAYMSEHTDVKTFYSMLNEFGFGSKTGIELPGETAGIFHGPEFWSARSKPTISMGQEIGVSALQILEAATAFANGGNRIGLTLISKITDSDGKILYLHQPTVKAKPISETTAKELLNYMRAEDGIGWRAGISDVPMSVKTGTAQMAEKGKRGYSKTDYISSCIALFPSNDPQLILYLVVIKPRGSNYGSIVAAPVISKTAGEIIDYYGMARGGAINIRHSGVISTGTTEEIVLSDTMPNLIGLPKKSLQSLFDKKLNPHYTVLLVGDGYVYEQTPAAGTPLKDVDKIELHLK